MKTLILINEILFLYKYNVLRMEQKRIPKKETWKAKNDPEKNLWGRLKKDGTDMGNGRERSKRETFVEEKE